MTTMYRIHANDSIGSFAVDCFSYEEFQDCMSRYREDPEIDGIWVEEYDEEEGWQA